MISIALSWFLIALFFIIWGVFINNALKLNQKNISIIIFLGMFFQCLTLSICCFFTNIGLEIFVLNSILTVICCTYIKIGIKHLLFENYIKLKNLNFISKFTFVFIIISSLYKCSLAPFLVDNESYYIQTIKWINEFGYVKGLANLHIFLAQTSTLHVLQAGFDFSFLTNNINDINGFILVVSSLFFIQKFEENYLANNKIHWIGLVPIFNVLFFQFIGQPSPDLILILVSQIIFYLFIEEHESETALKTGIIMFLMLFFIKITIAPIVLLILVWIFNQKKYFLQTVIFGLFLFIILVLKNIVLTGYPFYPFDFYAIDVDWKIPDNLFLFITESTKNTGYFENQVVINPTFYQKINAWLRLPGLNRVFNLGIILLFAAAIFTKDFRKNIQYRVLYLVLIIHFIALLLTSPQFRFFLPEFVLLSVIIIINVSNYLKLKFKTVSIFSLIFMLVSIVFIEYFDFKKLTSNKLMQDKSCFKIINLLIPENNSKYDSIAFEKIKTGNLEYNSPKENFFFFGTANGELPCVNKVQIDYLEKYYFIRPQLRTEKIQDGFCSEILKTPK